MKYYKVESEVCRRVFHILETRDEISTEDIEEMESCETDPESFGKVTAEMIFDDMTKVKVIKVTEPGFLAPEID